MKGLKFKLREYIISYFGVFIYIVFLVMFFDIMGFINPITNLLSYVFPLNLLSIKFWSSVIIMYIIGYIIPVNIQEGIYNNLNGKKVKFQFKPFYYDNKWQYFQNKNFNKN